MELFSRMAGEYEQVVWGHDPTCGLRAIIAVHSTVLGPALGGTRFYPYRTEADALEDVLRLAKGMTYKSAAAGLDLGGGKAVIIGNPATMKTEALMRSYARFVDSLSGRYITAEDVGTTQADMDLISRETPFVTGTSPLLGGSGDPSYPTARGVRSALVATAKHLGANNPSGLKVVISGIGKVGSALAKMLVEDGAKVIVADTNSAAVERATQQLDVASVSPDEAHQVECDIFSPCAMGAVLNDVTIGELRCKAVVGSANNQLGTDQHAAVLSERGVLYVPDFIVNAGGVMNIADELLGYHPERALATVERIGETVTNVLERSASTGITTVEAANRIAEERIAAIGALRPVRPKSPLRHRRRGF